MMEKVNRIIKQYLQNPTSLSLLSLGELTKIFTSSVVLLDDDDKVIKQMQISNKEVMHYYHQTGKPAFPYSTWFDKIIISDATYRKLNFVRNSPFLFRDHCFVKLVYYLKQPLHPKDTQYCFNEAYYEETEIGTLNINVSLANHQNVSTFIVIFDKKYRELHLKINAITQDLNHQRLSELLEVINHRFYGLADFLSIVTEDNRLLISYLKEIGFQDETLWHVLDGETRLEVHDQNAFEAKLQELLARNMRPKLLLHSCCGPCSSAVLKKLATYFEIAIYYYNPNIYPEVEFHIRLHEQEKIIACLNLDVALIVPPYLPSEYENQIKGLEHLPEGDRRCFACYALRMKKAAEYAKLHQFDYFTTTLSISPYKNAQKINDIGIVLETQLGVKFLYSNFKLNNGYQESVALSKKFALYRQDYCGCKYSYEAFQKAKAVE